MSDHNEAKNTASGPQFARRNFFKGSALAAASGAVWGGSASPAQARPLVPKADRLPREVWLATVSQEGLRAASQEGMIDQMLEIMEKIVPYQPDVICLPEGFPVANISESPPPLAERAEEGIGAVAKPFADFAKANSCHVVCAIHTKEGEQFYNSALFLDRQGEILGRYDKAHTTTGEMSKGISPGPLEPPLFEADFGKIGAQICFDIEWDDTWKHLSNSGAEIVFWPSAFAGGKMVAAKAWQHRYCVVSSTRKDTSRICDMDGAELAKTSRWDQWAIAPVNLEKAFLHTWPFVQRFGEVKAKYGRKIRITTHAEEEWSILESRDPDLKIADVLREYDMKSIREHLAEADAMQCECRA